MLAIITSLILLLSSISFSFAGSKDLILATTTSLQDSGLLDVLMPVFEKESGYRVKVIAVGSGEALALGSKGEADLIISHSPQAEEKFMKKGYGTQKRPVMENDFILVGPPTDPAEVRSAENIEEAFKKIAAKKAPFISRGDESGTHRKELDIWSRVKINPEESWYLETGQGMGETLRIADQKQGYTLVDRATFLSQKKGLGLTILSKGDKSLINLYSVIELNYERFPGIKKEGARALSDFLFSPQGQAIIREFGRDLYGQPLFVPVK